MSPDTENTNRRWLTLVAMTGSISMILIDQTVVSVALPTIQKDLGATETELQWIINAYILALAATVALGGRLGDIYGRVKAFIAGIVVFAVASALCGIAPDIYFMIGARALKGLGAALMVPAAASIVIGSFDIYERGKAMAVYAGVGHAFLAIGPLLGGFLTQYLSWRWVFWINLPIGLAAVILTLISKPDENNMSHQIIRVRYVMMLVVGLVALVFGLQQGSVLGWVSIYTIGAITGGLLLLAVFTYFQSRVQNPLIEVGLFKIPEFTADTILLFCIQFALISIVLFGAIYLQDVLGFGPLKAGFALMPIIVAVVIFSQMSGYLFDRVGIRVPALVGTALMAAGFFLQAPFLAKYSYMWIMPGMVILGIGVGIVMVPTVTDSLNRAPDDKRGQASGVVQTIRQMGGTIGLAAIGGLIATLEVMGRSRIADKYASSVDAESYNQVLRLADEGNTAALAELSTKWPGLVEDLHLSTTNSIAAGYYFAGAIVVVAFFVALFMMGSGRQERDNTASE